LTGREVLAVREHISTCASCRTEEAALRAMLASTRDLPKASLSADFNTKLLSRIAQERFAETRTKAFLPRRAPSLSWRTVAPVLSGALVLAVVAVAVLNAPQDRIIDFNGPSAQLDDSYRTVQPVNNPNMATCLKKDWSLGEQLAQTERLSRISGMLTGSTGFSNVYDRNPHGWVGQNAHALDIFRMRPVIRIYQPANSTQVTEARAIY
jgi:hypothetical protein